MSVTSWHWWMGRPEPTEEEKVEVEEKKEEKKQKKYTYQTNKVFVPHVYRKGNSASIKLKVHAANRGEYYEAVEWEYHPEGLAYLINHLQMHLDMARELQKKIDAELAEEAAEKAKEEEKDVP